MIERRLELSGKGRPKSKITLFAGSLPRGTGTLSLPRGTGKGRSHESEVEINQASTQYVLYVWGTSVVLSFCHRDCTDLSQTLIIFFYFYCFRCYLT